MFQKIIVAEDVDTTNHGIKNALSHLAIAEIKTAQYCEDAILYIKKAKTENKPFGLLITDLSFIGARSDRGPANGEDLIAAVRAYQPDMKIIVYSIENKQFKIKTLFEKYKIDGYVVKGLESIHELTKAIKNLWDGKVTHGLQNMIGNQQLLKIEAYDIEILKLLAKGLTQQQIAAEFQKSNITPDSKSSIEKHINKLKDHFRASNNVEIVAVAKDFGII
jgi:two-component system capsular synthesis response regulator RcsB